ncbi:MAG: tetratricopeptide repeat protein [Candidatus Omnitrophota bacterium]
MKKLIIFLISLGVFLAITGCAQDQYSIEKEYWRIKKQAENIFRNPKAAPANELDRAISSLQKFSQKNSKNILAVEADFTIAKLYIAKEEFGKSRKQFNAIIAKYKESEVICSEAVFLSGNSYQLEGKWNLALEQYKKVIANYPLTIRGLETPIYVAQYYKINRQPDKMLAAFGEAIAHYRGLAAKYPDSPLAFKAYTLIFSCYNASQDWQNSVNTLNVILGKFKGKAKMDSLLLDMALIYKKELKDEVKAKEAVERLIKEYPDSKFVNSAKALLKK